MKKIVIAICAAAACLAPALAEDLEASCTAYTQANDGDPSGCACLADTADASATQELLAVDSPDDLEGLSDGAKAAIAACWPNSAA